MPYCGRIGLSDLIDVAKKSNNKECIVCHYWYFNHGFNLSDVAINTA